MTVWENLMLGAYSRNDKAEIEKDLQTNYEIFPKLLERKNQRAGSLSGGEQQMLAIGRTLMIRPELIMFDEPSLGLSPCSLNKPHKPSAISINAAEPYSSWNKMLRWRLRWLIKHMYWKAGALF